MDFRFRRMNFRQMLRDLPGYLLRGALITGPLVATAYVLLFMLRTVDELMPFGIPGLGLVLTLVLVALVGYLSANVIGSGILLFSVTLIVIELVEARFPWRNFWLDWLMATAIVTTYILVAAVFSGGVDNFVQLSVIVPMLIVSIVLYPIVARLVAMLDRLRLMRVRRVS